MEQQENMDHSMSKKENNKMLNDMNVFIGKTIFFGICSISCLYAQPSEVHIDLKFEPKSEWVDHEMIIRNENGKTVFFDVNDSKVIRTRLPQGRYILKVRASTESLFEDWFFQKEITINKTIMNMQYVIPNYRTNLVLQAHLLGGTVAANTLPAIIRSCSADRTVNNEYNMAAFLKKDGAIFTCSAYYLREGIYQVGVYYPPHKDWKSPSKVFYFEMKLRYGKMVAQLLPS